MSKDDDELYENVVISLVKFVKDFQEAEMPGGDYITWDAHAELNDLPEIDLIGINGVGLAEDEARKYDIVFGISIAVFNDEGLARLTKLISKMRARLKAETRIPIYRLSDSGLVAEPWSWAVMVLPTAITPVGRAELRPVQSLELRALLDPGAASYLR